MMLALDTSTPECHMTLVAEGKVYQKNWLAERRLAKELLGELETFLVANHTSFEKLKGLIVFRGPGSYTGLRIGASVMNTLAYALTIPIVGQTGEAWLAVGQQRLASGNNDRLIIPEYGGLPNITQPKK
jgi:tRNA threonylcarbamoyladenosine biosynthesis protein TsaB